MQGRALTVGDGMRRHLVTLERDRENLEQSILLCGRLTSCQERLEELDAGAVLEEMSAMEQSGATFQNKQRNDVRIHYVAPLVIAGSLTLMMLGIIALIVWVFLTGPSRALPWPLLAALVALPLLVIVGVLLALFQRLGEIQKGEMDDAKNY